MPNYPPRSWSIDSKTRKVKNKKTIRTIYVGSLSLKDTFIKEYCSWLVQFNGALTLDIYSYNLHDDTRLYLEELKSPYIVFNKEGIDYADLPKRLSEYDLGVILYKGNTINYIYNAPNKLFEYLACNLKVLYPKVMLGIHPYNSTEVKGTDFNNLPSLDYFEEWVKKPSTKAFIYNAESVYKELINTMINDTL